jgi:hypothetical protein
VFILKACPLNTAKLRRKKLIDHTRSDNLEVPPPGKELSTLDGPWCSISALLKFQCVTIYLGEQFIYQRGVQKEANKGEGGSTAHAPPSTSSSSRTPKETDAMNEGLTLHGRSQVSLTGDHVLPTAAMYSIRDSVYCHYNTAAMYSIRDTVYCHYNTAAMYSIRDTVYCHYNTAAMYSIRDTV